MSEIEVWRIDAPETLPAVLPHGFLFGKEAGIAFDSTAFCLTWMPLLQADLAIILWATVDGKRAASIGGVIGPDLFDGARTLFEAWWYVEDRYRSGGVGRVLFDRFEKEAAAAECKRVTMVHLANVMPERVARIYEAGGYAKIETHYRKEIGCAAASCENYRPTEGDKRTEAD